MTHFPLIAFVCCCALAVATLIVEGLRRVKGPTGTLDNMRQRAVTWWGLLAIGVPVLMLPAPAAVGLFGVLAAIALREFLFAVGACTDVRDRWSYLVVPVLFFGIDRQSWVVLSCAGGLAVGILATVAHRRKLVSLGAALCLGGISSLAWLAVLDARSASFLLLALVVTQVSDAMQYVFGKLFGRTPLAPRLSPNKTVEGLLGGVGCAVAAGLLLGACWDWSTSRAAVLSAVTAVLGVVSGLGMSALKRHIGVKDWGTLLRGHGGALDRMDSLLLAGPALLLAYLLGI